MIAPGARFHRLLLPLLAGALSCTREPAGKIVPPGTAGSSSVAADGGPQTGPLDCAQPTAPRAPVRRLTRFEYDNTVRDLGLDPSGPADVLPAEELGNGFGNDADALAVSPLLIDGYRTVAQQIAERVSADPQALAALTGCDVNAPGDAACAARFIASFGLRAFRRPVLADESTMLQAVFDHGVQHGATFAAGISDVLEALLQSPQFLYRIEVGQAAALPGLSRPTDYEMASRLSYLFWGSTPDTALLDAASAGQLQTKEQVLAHAQRLLDDARSHDVVRFFHSQWLGVRALDNLVRNQDYYPTFEPGMGALFRQETESFIEDVVLSGQGNLSALFGADYTFVNEKLAAFYGIAGVSGAEFRKVPLDPSRRLGLLTHASVLAATTPGSRTDPVVRGKWVFNKLLCGVVPDPPPGVPQLEEPTPGVSVRQRLAAHREKEPCRSCHQMMDPFGFVFENFDGVGLWRDLDHGVPVDASAEIVVTDVAGQLNGAVELSRKLMQSVDAQRCYVGRWLTYAYGRVESDADACSRASLEGAFATAGGNVRQLLLALTQTDAFLYRPSAAPAGGGI